MDSIRRLCVEYMEDHGPICKLRDMQAEVMSTLSLGDWKPVSAVTRQLVKAGVLVQAKKGRSFWMSPGPNWRDAYEETDEDAELRERAEAVRLVNEAGGARVEQVNPMPKVMWAHFMRLFSAGELDLVFVPARARVVAYQVEKGTTVPIHYWDGLKNRNGKGHGQDVV